VNAKMITLMMFVATLAAPHFCAAHDFWVQPSSFLCKPGDLVKVNLHVGHIDEPENVDRNPQRIERFVLVSPEAESEIPGPDGRSPAGLVRPEKPGLHIIVYDSNHARSELEATKFEAYLREEGLESIIAERKRRDETGKAGIEIYSRCAKALINVGDSMPGNDRAIGLKLELVAGVDVTALKPGDELPVTLLLEGKAVAGIKVALKNAKNAHAVSEARTDKEGRALLKVSDPGVVLVTAVHMIPAPTDSGADWESIWASLTIEVASSK